MDKNIKRQKTFGYIALFCFLAPILVPISASMILGDTGLVGLFILLVFGFIMVAIGIFFLMLSLNIKSSVTSTENIDKSTDIPKRSRSSFVLNLILKLTLTLIVIWLMLFFYTLFKPIYKYQDDYPEDAYIIIPTAP
jgi:hypothetical protein